MMVGGGDKCCDDENSGESFEEAHVDIMKRMRSVVVLKKSDFVGFLFMGQSELNIYHHFIPYLLRFFITVQ